MTASRLTRELPSREDIYVAKRLSRKLEKASKQIQDEDLARLHRERAEALRRLARFAEEA